MPTGDIYLGNTTQPITNWSGSITVDTTAGSWYEYTTPYLQPNNVKITGITEWEPNNKKGDDDMRYLYEVILVNPKNDTFSEVRIVAKSETSALMKAYDATQFKNKMNKTYVGNLEGVDFDDLKTSCRVLMEWKKEKSLKKAIETIKEAVE